MALDKGLIYYLLMVKVCPFVTYFVAIDRGRDDDGKNEDDNKDNTSNLQPPQPLCLERAAGSEDTGQASHKSLQNSR